MTAKLLVVGGGLTGAVAAYRLRRSLGQNVDIECWEYLNDTGGRLATTKEQGVVADVATSVISLDMAAVEVQKMRDVLFSEGYLKHVDEGRLAASSERPLGSRWQHYFVPHGTSSLVDFLFQSSGVKVKTNCCVDLCSLDAKTWKWYVEASGGKSNGGRHRGATFDAVVLCNGPTHPGCDRMDNIWGEWQDFIDKVFWDALWSVSWSSCYVVTLSLTRDCLESCDRFFGKSGIQRTMNDNLIQYITYESRKRQTLTGKPSSCVVLVCHTTAEAMWYYKRAECVQAVQEHVLYNYLWLPKHVSRKAVHRAHSRCWGKCQVRESISSVLDKTVTHWTSYYLDSPPLVLCGDYFIGPTCSDAIVSATAAADAIAAMLPSKAKAEMPAKKMQDNKTPDSPSKRWADVPIETMENSEVPYSPTRRWADEPVDVIEESKTPDPWAAPCKRWGRNGPRVRSP